MNKPPKFFDYGGFFNVVCFGNSDSNSRIKNASVSMAYLGIPGLRAICFSSKIGYLCLNCRLWHSRSIPTG